MTNKGFTLLEMMLVLFVISSFMVLAVNNYHELNIDYIYFMNDYLDKQSISLTDKQDNVLDDKFSNYGISFNKDGRVNRAKTIELSNRDIVIHLGNGYITYE